MLCPTCRCSTCVWDAVTQTPVCPPNGHGQHIREERAEPSSAPAPPGCSLPPLHLQLLNPPHKQGQQDLQSLLEEGDVWERQRWGKELQQQQQHVPAALLLTCSWGICSSAGRGTVLPRPWAEQRGSAWGTDGGFCSFPPFLCHWHSASPGARVRVKERTSSEVACPRLPCQGDKSFCDHFHPGSSIQIFFSPPTQEFQPQKQEARLCPLSLPGSFTAGAVARISGSAAGAGPT